MNSVPTTPGIAADFSELIKHPHFCQPLMAKLCKRRGGEAHTSNRVQQEDKSIRLGSGATYMPWHQGWRKMGAGDISFLHASGKTKEELKQMVIAGFRGDGYYYRFNDTTIYGPFKSNRKAASASLKAAGEIVHAP